MDMLKRLGLLAENKYYWWLLVLFGMVLEGTALFYQYILNTYPCVLCIHVRIWVMAMILLALLACWTRQRHYVLLGSQLLMVVISFVLAERSYMLLGTERGFVFGDCSFNLGLPAWLALDKWFPFLFKVWDACGYTPKLLFGVTMAEALMVMSVLMVLWNLAMTAGVFINRARVTGGVSRIVSNKD